MADKFPGLGRGFIPPIRISDSYSSDSTDENKLFRNAETASTDSKGRLSVVPISASSCSDSVQSVLAEAASHMEIAELIASSQQEVQEQATEHVEALGIYFVLLLRGGGVLWYIYASIKKYRSIRNL